MNYIPYARQSIDQSDIEAVCDVLNSDWLTQGPVIDAFENKLKVLCNARYAVAVSSATAALHIACLAVGLGPGDRLWTSPNTFVASANCGLYCGAEVDFVDIELEKYNLSVSALEEKLIYADKVGKLPKVVVPVHFAGQSCDMKALKRLSLKYGFYIIEDASHAIGSFYDGDPVGCGKYSDIAVFSFHPAKIITAGEGGALLTNNSHIVQKLNRLRTSGITRDRKHMRLDHGDWYYEQLELGYNYRMTDIQAALGCSQLNKLEDHIRKRKDVLNQYSSLLSGLPVILPQQDSCNKSALHLFPILVHEPDDRKRLFDYFRQNKVGVNVHYIPVYKQPYYQAQGFEYSYCENTEYYYARTITLPIFPELSANELEYIQSILKKFYGLTH